jgi:short-subunit dehydrogenase
MNKKIFFVTGASGFIGREVCKILRKGGGRVLTVIKNEDIFLKNIGVEITIGDLWNKKIISKLISKSHFIIHCAGNAVFGNGLNYHKENYLLTKFIIKNIKKKNSTKFIFLSTIGAVDRRKIDFAEDPLTEESSPFPSSDYGKSKIKSEEIIKKKLINFTIIRPSLVIGQNMRFKSHFSEFARLALKGSFFSRFKWPGKFSVIDVEDLAKAIFFCCINEKTKNETFFCSGEQISLGDFFEMCRPNFFRISINSYIKYFNFLTIIFPFKLKALLLPCLTASDIKLRNLGWSPKISIFDTLTKIINREKARIYPNQYSKNTALVTGAGSGLGKSIAYSLLKVRKKVFLIDKNINSLRKYFNNKNNCEIIKLDLSKREEVEKFLKSDYLKKNFISEFFGCAGIGFKKEFEKSAIEDDLDIYEVNLISNIKICKLLVKKMKIKNFGRIVLISSSASFQPLPFMSAYSSSKSAILFFGAAISEELRNYGISISNILPGGIKTNFQEKAGVKVNTNEKLLEPNYVVQKIFEGLRKDKRIIIISFRSLLMSFMARILPSEFLLKLYKNLMNKVR